MSKFRSFLRLGRACRCKRALANSIFDATLELTLMRVRIADMLRKGEIPLDLAQTLSGQIKATCTRLDALLGSVEA